jgi:hypothetical protein
MVEGRFEAAADCTHSSAEDLFLAVSGRLEATRQEALDRHLADCATCRARAATLRWIHGQVRRWGDELFADHIPSEQLVRYAEARSLLPAGVRARIERHLVLCEACEEDLRMLRDVGDALDRAPVSLRPRVRAWLAPLARPVPAWAAAALLVLLLVPAGLGIRDWFGDTAGPGSEGPTVLPLGIPQVLESRTERDESAIPTLRVPTVGPLVVEVQAPVLDVSGVRYDARLVDAGGRELWRQDGLRSADAYGTFFLLLDASELGAGRYRLIVRETRPDGDGVEQFLFPFVLRRD